MQCGAGEMNAMPAGWRFVNHALLHLINVRPGRVGRACQTDALAAVAESEAFVGNASTLANAIRAGVAEAAVIHIPAMQARTSRQLCIPGERIQPSRCTVLVNQIEELLGELCLFGSHCWWWAIWRRTRTCGGSVTGCCSIMSVRGG